MGQSHLKSKPQNWLDLFLVVEYRTFANRGRIALRRETGLLHYQVKLTRPMSAKPGQAKSPAPTAASDVTQQLVARALSGDTRAFEELARLHETQIYRTCLAITHNVEDAEEAMQDAFFKAYRNLVHFRGAARFATWLTRIAVNEALQRLRKRKPTEPLDDLTERDKEAIPRQTVAWHSNPEQLYSTQEIRHILEEAIWALPVPYRIVFVLRDICSLTTAETGEALNLSIPAVKSRLLRARLMVRQSLNRRFRKLSVLETQIRRAKTIIRSLADRFCKAIGL